MRAEQDTLPTKSNPLPFPSLHISEPAPKSKVKSNQTTSLSTYLPTQTPSDIHHSLKVRTYVDPSIFLESISADSMSMNESNQIKSINQSIN